MTRASALSLHELSYLCGGPKRTVLTAILALCQSNQLEIGTDGRIYRLDQLVLASGGPTWSSDVDPVEQAVLDVVPFGLGISTTTVAIDSVAVRETRGMLVERGLATNWLPGLTRAGRRVRREVLANPPEGLRRIAVLGPEAIEDAQLRHVFTEPTHRLARQVLHPVRRGAASSA